MGVSFHRRFLNLSAGDEAELKELTEKIKVDQKIVAAYEQARANFDSVATVSYKRIGIT